MCGRYALGGDAADYADYLGVERVVTDPLPKSYNVAPTDPVYVAAEWDGERLLGTMRWGFVPHWADDLRSIQINARAETVAIRRRILSHAYGLAVHGNRAGALKHVEGYLAADEDTLEARLFMLNEMACWENGGAALEFGERLIDYCERHGFSAEAVRVRSIRAHLIARGPTGSR